MSTPKKEARRPLSVVALISLFLVGVAGWYLADYIWVNQPFDAPPLAPTAPAWRTIRPGETSADEAIAILGEPDDIVDRGKYRVYQYRWDSRLHWLLVELWTEVDTDASRVWAVLRTLSYYDPAKHPAEDVPTVEELLLQYGRPDRVTWSVGSELRYWIWARHGIAAKVEADMYRTSWEDFDVAEVLLFQPRTIRTLVRESLPWPENGAGWAHRNINDDDLLPEDPYDWSTAPLPVD
jgi:hypothetical protein